MRRRILLVALTAVVVAILVLGLPLAFAVNRIVHADERSELEKLALSAAVTVSPDYAKGDGIELPPTQSGIHLAVYDDRGNRVSGSGPDGLESIGGRALAGTVVTADVGEELVQLVPVTSGEKVIAVVRASSAESVVTRRVVIWWAGLAGLCLIAASCAVVVAAWESRRLARPLTALTQAAGDLGDGDFSVRTVPSGVAEIDAAGRSVNRTAERLGLLVDRERSFAAHASHQLRTPLTGLQLDLEAGLERGGDDLTRAAQSAMLTADGLSRTIDDVLHLAREGSARTAFDVETLLEECRNQWQGPLAAADRPLRVVVEETLSISASLPAARQILHVLLDNAFRHGRGAVSLHARESHGAVAIDVSDQGKVATIVWAGDGHLGLSMARSLAAAEGGRIIVDHAEEGTRFTVLLPAGSIDEPDGG